LEDWKIKIAVLWFVIAHGMLVFAALGIYEPGYIEGIIEGEVAGGPLTPEMNLGLAVVLLIPLVLAVLSLTLKGSINRWVNIIAGAVFAVLVLMDPVMYLAEQSAYSAYITLIGIVEFAASVLIVWYAWKSKQKA
jgi:hypothetical protein